MDFFFDNYAMILTLDLENELEDAAHPLSKAPMWVKYELYLAKGREDVILDGLTDGQIDYYRAPEERGPKTCFLKYVLFLKTFFFNFQHFRTRQKLL